MTNVIGVTVLQELKKFEGFEDAVIAGGFVRDGILGGEFKDIDIFFPSPDVNHFRKTVEKHFTVTSKEKEPFKALVAATDIDDYVKRLEKEQRDKGSKKSVFDIYRFDLAPNDIYTVTHRNNPLIIENNIGEFKELTFVGSHKDEYGNLGSNYLGKFKGKFMNFITVEIMGYSLPKKDFGDNLVKEFDFDINKCYYNGEDDVLSKEFSRDSRYMTATLSNLDSIEMLPAAMKKYERMKEKYPALSFSSSILELTMGKEKKSPKKDVLDYYTNAAAEIPAFAPAGGDDWMDDAFTVNVEDDAFAVNVENVGIGAGLVAAGIRIGNARG